MTEPLDAIPQQDQPTPPTEKQLTQAAVEQQTAIIRAGVRRAGSIDAGILLAMVTLQGQQIRVLNQLLFETAPDRPPAVIEDEYHKRMRALIESAIGELRKPKIQVAGKAPAPRPDA